MSEHLKLDLTPPVAVLRLNRPEKLNALTCEMIDALANAADRIEAEAEIRAAILTAEGGKSFCVGADIKAWSALSPLDMWRWWTARGHRTFDRLARLRVPVVAALSGHALGGGLELAATADIRIAEEHAKFGLPEVGIATTPGWSGTQRLVRRAGSQAVRRLVLTGDPVDAQTALSLGIVDEVVPMGAALARAREIAATIASRAPVSIQLAKQMVNAAEGEETGDILERMAGALSAFTEDAQEGAKSFAEKRPPNFKGC